MFQNTESSTFFAFSLAIDICFTKVIFGLPCQLVPRIELIGEATKKNELTEDVIFVP